MHKTAFKDLWRKAQRATVDKYSIVDDNSVLSSVLGEVVGKTFPTEFAPFACRNAEHFFEEISSKVGLQVKKAIPLTSNSTLFFESILGGVFGVKDSSTMHMKSLKEFLAFELLERWQNKHFRSAVKALPELRKYCLSDTRFDLPNLVDDWLRGAGTVLPMTTLMLEVAATAFNCQLGIVTLCYTGDPFLFLHGRSSDPRVYVGSNSLSGSQQRYFYFIST